MVMGAAEAVVVCMIVVVPAEAAAVAAAPLPPSTGTTEYEALATSGERFNRCRKGRAEPDEKKMLSARIAPLCEEVRILCIYFGVLAVLRVADVECQNREDGSQVAWIDLGEKVRM